MQLVQNTTIQFVQNNSNSVCICDFYQPCATLLYFPDRTHHVCFTEIYQNKTLIHKCFLHSYHPWSIPHLGLLWYGSWAKPVKKNNNKRQRELKFVAFPLKRAVSCGFSSKINGSKKKKTSPKKWTRRREVETVASPAPFLFLGTWENHGWVESSGRTIVHFMKK